MKKSVMCLDLFLNVLSTWKTFKNYFFLNDIEIRYLKSKNVASNLDSIVVRGDLYIVDTILIVRIVQGEFRRCEHTVQISKKMAKGIESL